MSKNLENRISSGLKMLVTIIVTILTMSINDSASAQAVSTLTVSDSPTPIRSRNFRIDPIDGVQQATLSTFNVKSESGDSAINQVVVKLQTHFTKPTTVYLYEGNTLIGSVSLINGFSPNFVYFYGLNHVVAQNTAQIFTIKADFASNTQQGSMSGAVFQVDYTRSNGTTETIQKEVTGSEHHFYSMTANFALVGAPTITKTSDQNGFTTEMTATFSFDMTADGGTVAKLKSSDVFVFAKKDALTSIPCTTSVITIPNNDIADGSTSRVTITATIQANQVSTPGMYGFELKQINWGTVSSGTWAYQVWGLEDFKTPATSYFALASIPSSPKNHFGAIGEDLYDWIGQMKYEGGEAFGEGEENLYVSSEDTYPYKRFIFPYPASPSKGHLLYIDYSMSSDNINPYIRGPKNPEASADNGFMVQQEYPALNLIRYNGTDGHSVKFTYRIEIGTFVGYATATRAGDFAWRTKIYWGTGASYDSPGFERDFLNLSPSSNSDGTSRPPRFAFHGVGDPKITYSGPYPVFSMTVRGIPNSYTIQESEDLRTWHDITVVPEYSETPNSDGTSTTNWLLPLSLMSGKFFRASLN